MVFDRSTQWFNENTCSARAEDPKSPFFRARQCSQRWRTKDLPVWPMYCRCQHPAHGTLYTSTLLWFAGTGSLGCTTSCRRVVKGWKVTWMAGGGDPTDGLGQSTNVGESQRSTGLTWSRRVCRSGCSQVYVCMNPLCL